MSLIPEDDRLVEIKSDWEKEWIGMPDFDQKNLKSWQKVVVHFATMEDREHFSKLIGQKLTHRTRSIWHPRAEIGRFAHKQFVTSVHVIPRYPIYIISKGRWKSRLTVRALEAMKLPFQIVVEPQEYKQYAAVIDPDKILKLPFSNLGQGSIPARNWVWKHARQRGAERHWILDDNIQGFYRLNDNLKTPVGTGSTFRAIENFVDRYENVGLAGMNYFMFAPRKALQDPYTLNTRIYSCILIKNDLKDTDGKPLRWRGRYNEDTDLSLRVLKTGLCTVLFNAFLAFKETTMTMKGGNTDELYQGDGRKKMAESLKEQHPELVKITWKWGRWQHHVDYSGFRQKLVWRPDVKVEKARNNFGMTLKIMDPEKRKKYLRSLRERGIRA